MIAKTLWICPLLLVFLLCFPKDVRSACDFSDVDCLTRASQWSYKAIVSGIKGLIEPADPLNIKEIVKELPTLKCHLTDVTMKGLANCQVTRVVINPRELIYEYFVRCPQLVINGNGDVKGNLDSVEIEGKGNINLIINDYILEVKGEYVNFVNEKDKKTYFERKTYRMESKPMGDVIFEASSGENSKPVQKNSKLIEKIMDPVIKSFIDKFADNVANFLKTFPLEELLSKSK